LIVLFNSPNCRVGPVSSRWEICFSVEGRFTFPMSSTGNYSVAVPMVSHRLGTPSEASIAQRGITYIKFVMRFKIDASSLDRNNFLLLLKGDFLSQYH